MAPHITIWNLSSVFLLGFSLTVVFTECGQQCDLHQFKTFSKVMHFTSSDSLFFCTGHKKFVGEQDDTEITPYIFCIYISKVSGTAIAQKGKNQTLNTNKNTVVCCPTHTYKGQGGHIWLSYKLKKDLWVGQVSHTFRTDTNSLKHLHAWLSERLSSVVAHYFTAGWYSNILLTLTYRNGHYTVIVNMSWCLVSCLCMCVCVCVCVWVRWQCTSLTKYFSFSHTAGKQTET